MRTATLKEQLNAINDKFIICCYYTKAELEDALGEELTDEQWQNITSRFHEGLIYEHMQTIVEEIISN